MNLLSRHERNAQSHEIARRVAARTGQRLRNQYGARMKVAEVPPGPPVLQNAGGGGLRSGLQGQIELAKKIKQIFQRRPASWTWTGTWRIRKPSTT